MLTDGFLIVFLIAVIQSGIDLEFFPESVLLRSPIICFSGLPLGLIQLPQRFLVFITGAVILVSQCRLVRILHIVKPVTRIQIVKLRRNGNITVCILKSRYRTGPDKLECAESRNLAVILHTCSLQNAFPGYVNGTLNLLGIETECVVLIGEYNLSVELRLRAVNRDDNDFVRTGQVLEGRRSGNNRSLVVRIKAFNREVLFVVLCPGTAGAERQTVGFRLRLLDRRVERSSVLRIHHLRVTVFFRLFTALQFHELHREDAFAVDLIRVRRARNLNRQSLVIRFDGEVNREEFTSEL